MRLWQPDWPAPPRVRSAQTTREGGVSAAPYHSLNLGLHVGDAASAVLTNRQRVLDAFQLPSPPRWMTQIHGTRVACLDQEGGVPQADAAVTTMPGTVCAIMTADCLPVLFCEESGQVVAAAHAGWRGLAEGVLESTVLAMRCPPHCVMAWMGPAIGPDAFEVGEDVRTAFVQQHPEHAAYFKLQSAGRYLADLFGLARHRLARTGVTRVFGGGACTHTNEQYFFSHRRDKTSGRMASLIWLAD